MYRFRMGDVAVTWQGEIEFRSLLFIPAMPPFGAEGNNILEKSRNIRLYVKRVFISDEFDNELVRKEGGGEGGMGWEGG